MGSRRCEASNPGTSGDTASPSAGRQWIALDRFVAVALLRWNEAVLGQCCSPEDFSTFGGKPGEAPPLLINPVDAAARGLEHVKRIRVWNDLGNVVLPLIISDAVPPGVVAPEKGAWIATSETGQTISALVSADARADLAKGACYNETAVEVQAWPA